MLFNTPLFIFIFLPIALLGYYLLNNLKKVLAAKIWLVLASLFFYGYWNENYLVLILTSIIVNYGIASSLKIKGNKPVLIVGILFNIGLLFYYKYTDFIIDNINHIFNGNIAALNLLLPLAISFFTFQQIAYLIDSYKGIVKEHGFVNYCLFVTFFPQLIAGPIVHHKAMMPQFSNTENQHIKYSNLAKGTYIFCLGLFKKIIVADSFAIWANAGFSSSQALTFWDAWGASLSYTFQLYYDFSAYADMAIGCALLFNIQLPRNFNSPYKALSIQDFWRRWHITLSSWLRDYLYIPLGGNQKGMPRTYINLMITFVLGGLWHGAAWTFVIWGSLHGLALIGHRIWQSAGFKLHKTAAWLLTFIFVNITWVFFRADNMEEALNIIYAMLGGNGFKFTNLLLINPSLLDSNKPYIFLFITLFGLIAFYGKNTQQLALVKDKYRATDVALVTAILYLAITYEIGTASSQFLYFNF